MSKLYSPIVLRYPGGKSKSQARDQIRAHFPDTFSEYREPFLGGAGIFSSVDPAIPRWINDLNRPLIAVYEALKARPKEFITLCQSFVPATADEPQMTTRKGVQYPLRLWNLFQEFLNDDDAEDQALRYLFLNRCSRFGRVILDPSRRSRTDFTNPKGWSYGLFERLAKAAEVLKDAKITCSDFPWLFEEPGKDVLVYADPPYMLDTLLSKSAKLYEYGFSVNDHRRMRDAVLRCNHRVVISYDDHSDIRELYRDFFIHEARWRHIGRQDKKMGNELIITNFAVLKTSVSMGGFAVPSLQLDQPDPSGAVPTTVPKVISIKADAGIESTERTLVNFADEDAES